MLADLGIFVTAGGPFPEDPTEEGGSFDFVSVDPPVFDSLFAEFPPTSERSWSTVSM